MLKNAQRVVAKTIATKLAKRATLQAAKGSGIPGGDRKKAQLKATAIRTSGVKRSTPKNADNAAVKALKKL
jgi:hypothetical protein